MAKLVPGTVAATIAAQITQLLTRPETTTEYVTKSDDSTHRCVFLKSQTDIRVPGSTRAARVADTCQHLSPPDDTAVGGALNGNTYTLGRAWLKFLNVPKPIRKASLRIAVKAKKENGNIAVFPYAPAYVEGLGAAGQGPYPEWAISKLATKCGEKLISARPYVVVGGEYHSYTIDLDPAVFGTTATNHVGLMLRGPEDIDGTADSAVANYTAMVGAMASAWTDPTTMPTLITYAASVKAKVEKVATSRLLREYGVRWFINATSIRTKRDKKTGIVNGHINLTLVAVALSADITHIGAELGMGSSLTEIADNLIAPVKAYNWTTYGGNPAFTVVKTYAEKTVSKVFKKREYRIRVDFVQ